MVLVRLQLETQQTVSVLLPQNIRFHHTCCVDIQNAAAGIHFGYADQVNVKQVLSEARVGFRVLGGDAHVHEQMHDAQLVRVVFRVGVGHQVAGGVRQDAHGDVAGAKAGFHFTADFHHVDGQAFEQGSLGQTDRGDFSVLGHIR